MSTDDLEKLDCLLSVDPVVGQTRFGWLRSASGAPGADNLLGLIDRVEFLRTLGVDPLIQARVHANRWNQLIQEGDATPAWLTADFNANRRRATILAQLVKLEHNLTDEAATKLLYLILNRSEKEWKMPPREWAMAKAQFAVLFGERFIRAMAA